jgi:23S rRNA (cytidine1920-2'-O)/16S rRNA (cytidine1409-2'-O)-methyltransferase
MPDFVSRAGIKLEAALAAFSIDVAGHTCADLGSNTGGFVDCLLRRGAAKVYAIERGYGVLDYNLRKDPRVVVMERTNAMHVILPEKVRLVTVDVSWTRQKFILPNARQLLDSGGSVISLIKPHYEADKGMLRKGILGDEHMELVLARVQADISAAGFAIEGRIESPIRGGEGNREFLVWLTARP